MTDELTRKILDRSAVVAVVGLGYVGLPLAVGFAEKGYEVLGIDLDVGKIEQARGGVEHDRRCL